MIQSSENLFTRRFIFVLPIALDFLYNFQNKLNTRDLNQTNVTALIFPFYIYIKVKGISYTLCPDCFLQAIFYATSFKEAINRSWHFFTQAARRVMYGGNLLLRGTRPDLQDLNILTLRGFSVKTCSIETELRIGHLCQEKI